MHISTLRAETGPSPQLRSIGSPYEKADVRQHVALSTAVNGWCDSILTGAAPYSDCQLSRVLAIIRQFDASSCMGQHEFS
jgi:hypothetical protein